MAIKAGASVADALEAMSKQLELKLADFNVEAVVVSVLPGPVITRFEIQPAAGVKVQKISALAKDLARSLAVISVRIVEVIPGKPYVGIEIPNEHREIVQLHEVINSSAFQEATSHLALALGKDIAGATIVADIARMPHLLVAGTTGSGKSVGVNSALLSILLKATPEQVRLILVDPKMLELSIHEGIPHLGASGYRYERGSPRAELGGWGDGETLSTDGRLRRQKYGRIQQQVKDAAAKGESIKDPLWPLDPSRRLSWEALPAVVIVIDEFADMMMIVGKKVEQLIARIAQKARAAGIHLILATQRPSVDVITGLIKANIPSRISFQVSSRIDSRTILDQAGLNNCSVTVTCCTCRRERRCRSVCTVPSVSTMKCTVVEDWKLRVLRTTLKTFSLGRPKARPSLSWIRMMMQSSPTNCTTRLSRLCWSLGARPSLPYSASCV